MTIREDCATEKRHADIVLVLDASTSMNRPTRTGRSKLAATQDAAVAFIGLMDFAPDAKGGHDQVAVVGFNSEAWIEAPLGKDGAAAVRAVWALSGRQAQLTRLDLAFERGAEALRSPARKAENAAELVLLTDGLPNQVPLAPDGTQETTVLRAAAAAKGAGVRVYTIAIGAPEDTNPALLIECATEPGMYYYTPDPEDLGRIYGRIAAAIGCPKERLGLGGEA